jgi:RecA-family ATPase
MAIDILEAFTKEPPPLDFVWPGFVAGTVACLAAAGSTGKSFLAIEAAMGVASKVADETLLGLGIKKYGKAVILNAEDPEAVIVRRLHAIGAHLDDSTRKEVAENLIIDPLMGKGCNIQDKRWLDAVMRIATGARLVILDTFSRWHRGKENDNGEMATVLSLLEQVASETGASVLFLHHVSKGMALDGRQDEQQATRGAAAITDNARWQGFMQTMTLEAAKAFGIDPELRKSYVIFGGNKENYGQPSTDMWLRRHEGGVLLPTMLEPINKSEIGGRRNASKD